MAALNLEAQYQQRLARYVTAMRNEKPDCVPIRPFVAEFTAKYAGYTCQEVTHDYAKAFNAAVKTAKYYDWDAVVPNMVYVWSGLAQAAGLRYFGIPGIGIPHTTGFNYIGPPEDEASSSEHSGATVLSLIRDVREGRLSGPMLERADRQRVVEHLTGEGYSGAEIAEILKVSERTVIRDRIAVREQNALEPSDAMVAQVVGQMVRVAEQVAGRLRRIGREAGTKASEKIEAELGVWQVHREMVVTLQGLGYLPIAATHVNAHITAGDDLPEAQELLAEIDRLSALPELCAADGTPVMPAGLAELRTMLARTVVADRLGSLGIEPGGSLRNHRPDSGGGCGGGGGSDASGGTRS